MKLASLFALSTLLFFFGCHYPDDSSTEDTGTKSDIYNINRKNTKELIEAFDDKERLLWQKPEEIMSFLGDLTNVSVLDLGAGSGYFTFQLGKYSNRVVAADTNEELLAHIQKRIDQKGSSNITVRKAEPNHPPINYKGEFKMVLMVNTFYHIQDRPSYFKELADSMKVGGNLVIVDFKRGHFPIGPDDRDKMHFRKLIYEIESYGFKKAKSDRKTLPYQFMMFFRRTS